MCQRTRCPWKVSGAQTECHLRPGGSSPGSDRRYRCRSSNHVERRPGLPDGSAGSWEQRKLLRPAQGCHQSMHLPNYKRFGCLRAEGWERKLRAKACIPTNGWFYTIKRSNFFHKWKITFPRNYVANLNKWFTLWSEKCCDVNRDRST